ncbi:hypothetical protein SAMN05192574_105222 [Mucilaginibacter gossypiicola]|uniref:Uncharacterized protein n=1 Tax=Mucilaginibacter gossypiicola TaxID=551995 RepID=A0A1H8LRX2_9SPHI|nr:hypothetical protein [Mucilaginibacter gossypiicola]SEO07853.1 hypothetical protein SAMN05192574_105222 [Mucilaginibacter gossypiicola]
MNVTTDFKFQSLLTLKNDSLSGPISPLLFAKDMAAAGEFKFNRLARVWFTDERINQRREDGGLTGFDSLIIGMVCDNDVWLSLWVDMGVGGLPIAMACQSDGEVIMTPAYPAEHFERKLGENEVDDIFSFLFQHIEVIAIKQETDQTPEP